MAELKATGLDNPGLRRAVLLVAGLNLAYGLVEYGVALRIGSVSLFADSIDFFEDAGLNLLIALSLGSAVAMRARIGKVLAIILLVPAAATLWMAFYKLLDPRPLNGGLLGLAGFGALLVNLTAASLLARHRKAQGSLAMAAWLSARNDALANLGIIAAAIITAYVWRTAWPDLVVGLVIFWLNLDAAQKVWRSATAETASLLAASGSQRP